MANISAIKLPNGTTYNLKDSVSGYTTNTGTITQVKTTAGAHSTINVSSGAASFNVPTKTSHLTNDSGFLTSHQTLYEANLNWGGKDFSASYSPIDAAMIDVLGANRFAFLKAAGLTIEYSTNGGSSYTDYGATDAQKVGLFSSGQSFYLGKHTTNGSSTLNDQLRITISTSAAGIYTVLNKIAIYMSTQGNTVQVKIEKALESTPTTYSVHKDWTGISGWSGWNILNISGLTTYGNAASSQYGRVRFTFRQTAITSTYSAALITKIMGFGGVGWTVPSTMAATGHLYSYDSSQNATFPAKVTATQFNGALNGNASTSSDATNLLAYSGNEVTIGASSATPGASTNDTVWINYRDHSGGGVSNNSTQIIHYHFGNRKGNTNGVILHAASFDGNVTGTASNVTGTVAIANGGTGQTTAANAINALLNGLPTWTADPTDTTYFIRQDTGGSAVYGKVQATTLWNYISGKLPAWSKASTKPTYTASEVGALPSNHTYTTSIATSTATNQITLAYGTKYAITAGGTSYVFTMPSADDTNTWRKVQLNGTDKLGTGTSTNPLNLKAGTNVSITESSGTFTFSATDTDTKVTAVGNHYTPAEDTSAALSADASSSTAATWNSTSLVTGVNLQRDAKGHVVGVTVDSIKMPANPNSDYKVSTAAVTSGTIYYPTVGEDQTSATSKFYDASGFKYGATNGTANGSNGAATLILGNSKTQATAGWKAGIVRLYGNQAYYTDLRSNVSGANKTINLPNATGTVALTSDIPTNVSDLTNDSNFISGITSSMVTTALGYTPYNSTNPNGYTTNTGTVTKVTAGTGLSIGSTSGGNFTTTGTINHTNSVTAQTTQALYPIKIDAQGHISAYGSAVTVPTKVSQLTNDEGYIDGITKAMVTTALGTGSGTTKFLREDGSWATPAYIANTDAKLQVAEVTSATQYYPLVGTGTTAATRQYDTTGFKYKGTTGTTSAIGAAILELGNSTASGTAGNKQGQLIMYGTNAKKATITLAAPSADIALALPTSGGTLALTSQIPTVSYPVTSVNSKTGAVSLTASDVGALPSSTTIPSITLNGSGSTSPSFYAPTSAGTSGYVLKSNGSGAPTWTSATLTDTKVTQTATTTNASYEILFSSSADNTTRTEGTRKTSGLIFNPSTNNLFIGLNTSATSGLDKEITDKLTTLDWLDVVS